MLRSRKSASGVGLFVRYSLQNFAMRIASQSPTELVVKDSSMWISALCAGVALALILFGAAKAQPNTFLGAAVFLVFAMLADCRTTFTFDAIHRVVQWNGRKFLRNRSGTIAFDDIADITIEALSSGDGGPSHRLAILTSTGATPMSYVYSGVGNFEQMRATIMAFVHPGAQNHARQEFGDDALESSIRSLLIQDRKTDAIALFQSRQRVSLKDAVARVDAIGQSLKLKS